MLRAASETLHELNRLELLPLIGVLLGLIWFRVQPQARKPIPVKKEANRE